MITSLAPYFPNAGRPTSLLALLEANRDCLPPDVAFAYLRIGIYNEFCRDDAITASTDPGAVRRVLSGDTVLILDLSTEGPAFTPALAKRIARFANMYAIAPHRMILVQTNESFVDGLRASTESPNVAASLQVAWHHHHLWRLLESARRNRWWENGHRQIGKRAKRTTPFLCLNATPRPHRAALAYLIATHPRRSAFVCSFDIGGPKGNDARLQRDIEPFLVPLKLAWGDVEPVIADAARFDRTALASLTSHQLVGELEPKLYRTTRMSLVTETEMSAGDMRRTTEKIFKPLLLGQPLLTLANPMTLELVRAMGFDLFDDHLDNGYDRIVDPVQRFLAVWALVNGLLADDASFAVDPAIADRLHANVALFEGALMAAVKARVLGSLCAAIVRAPPPRPAPVGSGRSAAG